MFLNPLFYFFKPLIPRSIQIVFRKQIGLWKLRKYSHIWPIDPNAGGPPDDWSGWPDQKRFALVLTHDVDTAEGHKKCRELMDLEKSLGVRSSFNFVPERYSVSSKLRQYLTENGFEVAVHGLNHDGKLFWSKKIFSERAIRINHYLEAWNAVGFNSPAMHCNLDWMHDLTIEYDQSTFDTDPFEPQPDGVGTIFPFLVQGNPTQKGYVELPYTLPQDFTLFVVMKEKNIKVWKEKLDWIAEKGGMVLLNTHPDYMHFKGKGLRVDEYPAKYYVEFLEYIKSKYKDQYWHVLPRDMAKFWSKNLSMMTPFRQD